MFLHNRLCPKKLKDLWTDFCPYLAIGGNLPGDFSRSGRGKKKEMPPVTASPGNAQLSLAHRSVVDYALIPPTQPVGGTSEGEEAPHQGDQPFRQTAVHRMGQDRGEGHGVCMGSAAGEVETVFIHHFSGTFYFSSQNPDWSLTLNGRGATLLSGQWVRVF